MATRTSGEEAAARKAGGGGSSGEEAGEGGGDGGEIEERAGEDWSSRAARPRPWTHAERESVGGGASGKE